MGLRQPQAVELYYELAITRLMRGWARKVLQALKPAMREAAAVTDAIDDDLDKVAHIGSQFASSEWFKSHLTEVSKRTKKHSEDEFKRLDISLFGDEPKLGRLAKKWQQNNIKLVTALTQKETAHLGRILASNQGKPVKALARQLAERLEISTRKARLIARTETNKLNSQINEERLAAAKVTEATWTTMGDERVSDSHAELDGTTFKIKSPPTDSDGNSGLPGAIRPNCRCIMYPVVPEFRDEPAKKKRAFGSALPVQADRNRRRTGHRKNLTVVTRGRQNGHSHGRSQAPQLG